MHVVGMVLVHKYASKCIPGMSDYSVLHFLCPFVRDSVFLCVSVFNPSSMNRSYTTLCFCLIYVCSYAQIKICNQVTGATGASRTILNRHYAYTVGEPVIATISNASFTFTQGFHQPELCQTVATQNLDLSDWGPEVFPVPTEDRLNIRFTGSGSGTLRISVYDLLGRAVITDMTVSIATGAVLHCESWQPGTYFLQFRNPDKPGVATLRFVRI
jgi:hypothetical protein